LKLRPISSSAGIPRDGFWKAVSTMKDGLLCYTTTIAVRAHRIVDLIGFKACQYQHQATRPGSRPEALRRPLGHASAEEYCQLIPQFTVERPLQLDTGCGKAEIP
jgi:hypothetical protein